MATSMAWKATMVLPEPTSPCSSRRMGLGLRMSVTISPKARFCATVGWKGSTSRIASRTLSVVAKPIPARSRMRRRLSSRPSSRKNSSSKISRRCAGVEALCNCVNDVPSGGKWTSRRAVSRSGRSSRARNVCGRHSGTAPRTASSRLKITFRCHRDVSRLPPSDS